MPSHRRHRRYASGRTHSLHPLAVVGIVLAAAILLTLVIGWCLSLWLDEDTFRKFTESERETDAPESLFEAKVRRINAYPFVLGDDVGALIGTPALSVSLNDAQGALTYQSPVAAYLGLSQNSDVSLAERMAELTGYSPHISGVFHPQAFRESDPDLFYTATQAEVSLLREFVRSGGNELLLRVLPLEAASLEDTLSYLRAVKSALPRIAVGVAVPASALRADGGGALLSNLLSVCDFCALDLSDEEISDDGTAEGDLSPAAQQLLSDFSYFLTAYDLRVVLEESQAPLLLTLELTSHPNYQVLPAKPTPTP